MKSNLRYKFLREIDGKIRSDNGDITWKIGKLVTYKGELKLCHSGLHCSKEISQAFSFVQGEILAQVECSGKHLEEEDKDAWQKMKIVKAWKWQKEDSVALAIFCAELVIDIFEKEYPDDKRPREAIKAAKKWLKNPTEKNRAAADAADAADAAWAAAWAARDAAWAAWAARDAVEAATWTAITTKIENWMVKRIEMLEPCN